MADDKPTTPHTPADAWTLDLEPDANATVPATAPNLEKPVFSGAAAPVPTSSSHRVAPRPPGSPSVAPGPARPASPSIGGLSGASAAPTGQAPTGTAGRPAPAPLESLTQIQDYRIVKPLGRGGMAHVYLGQRKDGHLAAIKLLLPQYAADEEIVRRFMLEMKAGAQLRHENLIEIKEFGDYQGHHFLVAEYMDAGSVRDLVVKAGGRLAPPVAEAIGIMLLRGLGAAHAQNVIHRDVKPANMLVRIDGIAKLGDFGIARALELPGITKTGLLMGTPAYMSPEQARGDKVDHRSDLFSAGTMLFELLSGFNPFAGQNEAASIMSVITTEAPLLFEVSPTLPPHLEAIVARLLAKDPAARYATAKEALDDFERDSPAAFADPAAIVREAIASPGAVYDAWRRKAAREALAKGVALLAGGPARKPVATLHLLRAELLDPKGTAAGQHLKEIYGGRDPFAPPANPKIAELEEEVRARPGNAALLLQLAQLHRMENSLLRAVLYLKRAVRLRPDDGYAVGQLKSLVAEEAESAITAGHLTLKTMPPRPAPAPVPIAPGQVVHPGTPNRAGAGPMAPLGGWTPTPRPSGLRARAPLIIGILVLLGGGLWAIRAIGQFVKQSAAAAEKASEDLSRGIDTHSAGGTATAAAVADRAQVLRAQGDDEFKQAARLAAQGDPTVAEEALQRFRNEHPKNASVPDATYLIGELALRDRRPMAAAEELARFLREAPTDPRVPQARWMLAQAKEQNGDAQAAIDDIEGLVRDHPASPVVTAALSLQASLFERRGDADTARARYEQVRARTGPADPLHRDATEALTRLGAPPPPAPPPAPETP